MPSLASEALHRLIVCGARSRNAPETNLCYSAPMQTHDAFRSLYIVSKAQNAGSMLVALGLTELLKRRFSNVAFFRPIIPDASTPDSDVTTVLSHFELDQAYESAVGVTVPEVEQRIADGKLTALITELLQHFSMLQSKYDFVLCDGLADEGLNRLIDFDINVEIAKNFTAPIVGVFPAKGEREGQVCEAIRLWNFAIEKQGASLFLLIANRCDAALFEAHRNLDSVCHAVNSPVALFPDVRTLDKPDVAQMAADIGAKVLLATAEGMQRTIFNTRVAAMRLENFLSRIEEGDLIITPADRSDILIAALLANDAADFPGVSAIVLTGGFEPSESVIRLVRGLKTVPIPILQIEHDTVTTALRVASLSARLESEKKIATALGVFHTNVDGDKLLDRLSVTRSDTVTPVMFEHRLFERAQKQIKTIALPESEDDRILHAADILIRRRVVNVVLIGDPAEIERRAVALGLNLKRARIIDTADDTMKKHFARLFFGLRKHKGVTIEGAYDAVGSATLFATMMVFDGQADGMVSGATHTTRDTILPALQTIKTKPDYKIVSSCFFMCFDTRVLVYADCAVNPDPNAEQLAEIAIASAETAAQFDIEPRVAMLSYSTGSSGVGSDVEKVREAVAIVRERRPELLVDGPIQYDAAIDPKVGEKKMPGSPVAGKATVFIFPDLNTGNNTYKAVQRSAGAVAVGPVLQGLNKPVNDLSRGCSVADIVNTVAITAIQAQGES